MLVYIARGVAIAEILYVLSAIWREELNRWFVLLLSLIAGVLSCIQILS